MNENLLGKKLKHKGASDAEASKVVRVKGDWVDFDNSTSVLKEKIKDNFVEVKGEINDPEAFLENASVMSTLMSQIVNNQKGGISVPDGDNMSVRNNVSSVEQVESHPVQMDEAQLLAAAKAARGEQEARNLKARLEQQEWARSQGLLDDDGGEEIVIDADSYLKEKTPLAGQNTKAAADVAQYMNGGRPAARPAAPANPVASIFESMKRPKQVKIRFEVTEMIPKLESIKNFEDMFSFDIIETLSAEITDRILKNPRIIEEAIKKQLEMLVRPKKKKKVATQTQAPKKKSVLKTQTEDTEDDN